MTSSPANVFRRFVDGILIINMDSNSERYAAVTEALRGVLPEERIERLSAVVGRELPGFGERPWFTERTGERAHVWAGAAGCTLSHRKGIALAKERGWKRVLMLEDDARPALTDSAAALLQEAFETCDAASLLYLGYNRPVPHGICRRRKNEYELWQIDGVLATHAYIVSEEAYDTLLSVLPTEATIWEWMARYRAIDTFYRDYVAAGKLLPVYAVYPTMFHQAAGTSDITQKSVNGDDYACSRAPYPAGWLHRVFNPLRRLKVHLNSLWTLRRARCGGLPGQRRPQ